MRAFSPAVIWLVVILILSGYPGDYVPKVLVWQFDKLVHSLIYTILSVCLMIAFSKQYSNRHNRFKITLFIVLFGIFYGGFMEFLQDYIFINRSGNWYDFIANSIGAILGVFAYPLILKKLPINRWFKIK